MPIIRPKPRIKPNGSVLGKNRKTHKKTSHQLNSDSNAKKRMTAEEFKRHEREIKSALRNMKGRRDISEAELD